MAGSMASTGAYSHNCDPKLDAMITAGREHGQPGRPPAGDRGRLLRTPCRTRTRFYLYSADGAFAMNKSVHWTPFSALPYTEMKTAYGS